MLQLTKVATPLEPVEFPNGSVRAVRVLDAEGWELLREVERSGDDAQARALVQYCVPDATDDDIASMGVEDAATIALYAARKIKVYRDEIKNSSGEAAAEPAPTSPPSSPGTTPSTS